MITAYRSYAYLLTDAAGAGLEKIKALFHDCDIKQVPRVSNYNPISETTEYLYLIRVGNNGRFIQTAAQTDYDITVSIPAGAGTYAGELTRGAVYDIDMRDYPNALFHPLAH